MAEYIPVSTSKIHKHRSITEKVFGVILICLGLIAFAIPGIPGIILIIIGLGLLGEKKITSWVRTLIARVRHKTSRRKTHK